MAIIYSILRFGDIFAGDEHALSNCALLGRWHGLEYAKRLLCLASFCAGGAQRVVRNSNRFKSSRLHRLETASRLLCLASLCAGGEQRVVRQAAGSTPAICMDLKSSSASLRSKSKSRNGKKTIPHHALPASETWRRESNWIRNEMPMCWHSTRSKRKKEEHAL